jgi:hypothetical protein
MRQQLSAATRLLLLLGGPAAAVGSSLVLGLLLLLRWCAGELGQRTAGPADGLQARALLLLLLLLLLRVLHNTSMRKFVTGMCWSCYCHHTLQKSTLNLPKTCQYHSISNKLPSSSPKGLTH